MTLIIGPVGGGSGSGSSVSRVRRDRGSKQWLIVAVSMMFISDAVCMFAQCSSFKSSSRRHAVVGAVAPSSLGVLSWSMTSSSRGERVSGGDAVYHLSCVLSSIKLMIHRTSDIPRQHLTPSLHEKTKSETSRVRQEATAQQLQRQHGALMIFTNNH